MTRSGASQTPPGAGYRGGMADWEDVRRLVAALPGTEEGTGHQGRVWRVGGRTLVWERPLRRADRAVLGEAAPAGDVLCAWVADLAAKDALIDELPAAFTTPHFDGYAMVLVDLGAVAPGDLEELVLGAWLARAPRRLARAYLDDRRGGGDDPAGPGARD
jgi:hypothetical protein